MQSSSPQVRSGEAVTEPSGHGPFAEAMRELIAELPVAGSAHLQLLRGAGARRVTASGARQRAHLQLVR